MLLDELTTALHDVPPTGPRVDPERLRRRGRALRTRRRAGAGTLTLALVGGGFAVASMLDDPRGGPGEADVATGTTTTLTAYEKEVLAAVPGAYAADGTVVVPGPIDPGSEQNQRIDDGDLAGPPVPLGFHGYTDPGYLASTVTYPAIVERRQMRDDRTGMDVVADNGPVSLGCLAHAGDACSPAVLVGGAATGWFYLYGLGTDRWLEPGAEMEVFLDESYPRGGARHSVIGGLDGADTSRVELTLVDGARAEATVDAGELSQGDTLFWAETTAEVARVTAYDAAGDVIDVHEVRACTDPVDCEVR
jgi:hypothetical protein